MYMCCRDAAGEEIDMNEDDQSSDDSRREIGESGEKCLSCELRKFKCADCRGTFNGLILLYGPDGLL